jgi:hypothetical protein
MLSYSSVIQFIKRHNINPILIILFADFLMIAMHIAWGQKSVFFNLDQEANLPTLYQGAKILIFAMLIWLSVYNSNTKKLYKYFGLLIASSLFFLGLDELATIHENIHIYVSDLLPNLHNYVLSLAESLDYGGALWVIYYAPFVLIISIIWALQIYIILKHQKQSVFMMVLGMLFIIAVPFVEMINTSSNFSSEIYDNWVVLEEGLEMIGVSLFAFGYYKVIQNYTKTDITKK